MGLPRFDPFELHTGFIIGPGRTSSAASERVPQRHPREVFDDILLDALREPPCTVLFSGGKDSSVMLAGAQALARRHGLPPPIALTTRHAAHPLTNEDEWQERVISHLGVEHWRREEIGDELDLFGEISAASLHRHGAYWPANAHSMILFAQLSGKGTMVTGIGGDEIFDRWLGRRGSVRESVRYRPVRQAAKWTAFNALPSALRHRVRHPNLQVSLPWLTPAAGKELNRRIRANMRLVPTWRSAMADFIDSRLYELATAVMGTFVAEVGPRLVSPFMDPRMIRSVAAAGPRNGFDSRGQALTTFFSDLLPPDILTRTSKAIFTQVNWGPRARDFVASWDGGGVDPAIVDPERLREIWSRDLPDGRTLACLQLAWLAAQ